MYTLRSIQNDTNGVESNHEIGQSYILLNRKQMSNDEKFLNNLNFYSQENYSIEELDGLNVQGIIIGDSSTHPLHENTSYYIMTDTGKTFEAIKFK